MDAPTDTLSLEQQICFALYNASRALTSRYRDLLEPLGLTYPQYLTLLVLWESGASTVSELGARLHLDSGTLSPLLRRLEANGLLRRERGSGDERVVTVTLTDAGAALRAAAAGIPEQICLSTGLTLESIAALRDQVMAVADSVRAA